MGSSKVRRIMGAFEAIRPKMLEVGEVLAAPALEDFIPSRAVYGTRSGTAKAVAAGCSKQVGSLESGRQSSRCRAISSWEDEAHQEQVAGRLHCWRRGEVEAGCHRGGVRHQRRPLCGYTSAEGSALCGQLLRHRENRDSRSSTTWWRLGVC